MNRYIILCVDDERAVLDSVMADLEPFATQFELEAAQSVTEARELLNELESEGKALALILCDHIMPDELGVDFLVELNQSETHQNARKLLLTGQAGLEATIEAVNQGGLDYYIAKPWQPDFLQEVIRAQLTEFILEQETDPLPFTQLLDSQKIFEYLSKHRLSL